MPIMACVMTRCCGTADDGIPGEGMDWNGGN